MATAMPNARPAAAFPAAAAAAAAVPVPAKVLPGPLAAYEFVKEIGSGSFGRISQLRRRSNGQLLACKEVSFAKMVEKEKMQLVSEVNILRELRHPNIVRYYERFIDRENYKIYIVMEFCNGGDLTSVIKRLQQERRYMDEEVAWKLFTQIVVGLHHCHARKAGPILHRDIKPDNVFLENGLESVKLGDFGLSRTLDSPNALAQTFLGTPYYMSPEQISHQAYNLKSDIWSLGCLLYEMCALVPPFDAPNQSLLNVKIKAGRFAPLPAQYSSELNRVIKWMLDLDPNARPSTDQLLQRSHIRLCHREQRVNQHYMVLKKREEEVAAREAALVEREAALAKREEAVRRLEAGVNGSKAT